MGSTLPSASVCCEDSCEEQVSVAVPGPQGPAGADGTDGTDGVNAFTTITGGAAVMPAEGANVTLGVVNSTFLAANEVVYVQQRGYLEVQSKPTSTSVILKNLENTASGTYAGNSPPGTVFTAGLLVTAGGVQGPSGVLPGGSLLAANNLSDVANAATSRGNLGLGSAAVLSNAAIFLVANNLSEGVAATKRSNLGLTLGSNVQAFDATLQSLSALGTIADRVAYTTGVDTWAETPLTAAARTILDDTTIPAIRTTLGVLSGYGLLGSITGLNLNSATTDTAVTIASARYRIDKITLESPSAAVTTATAGLFTAAGGGGVTLCADQALAATLTATTKFQNMTQQAIVGTDIRTEGTLYARVGTAEGAARMVNCKIYGWAFDAA